MELDAAAPSPAPRRPGDVPEPIWPAIGVFLGVSVIGQLAMWPLSEGMSLWFPGVSQVLYVVPLVIWAWRTKRRRLLQVSLIGAGVVFLLNATCTVIFLSTTRIGG